MITPESCCASRRAFAEKRIGSRKKFRRFHQPAFSASKNTPRPVSGAASVCQKFVEFRRRCGERKSNHFLRRHVRLRKYFSACKRASAVRLRRTARAMQSGRSPFVKSNAFLTAARRTRYRARRAKYGGAGHLTSSSSQSASFSSSIPRPLDRNASISLKLSFFRRSKFVSPFFRGRSGGLRYSRTHSTCSVRISDGYPASFHDRSGDISSHILTSGIWQFRVCFAQRPVQYL